MIFTTNALKTPTKRVVIIHQWIILQYPTPYHLTAYTYSYSAVLYSVTLLYYALRIRTSLGQPGFPRPPRKLQVTGPRGSTSPPLKKPYARALPLSPHFCSWKSRSPTYSFLTRSLWLILEARDRLLMDKILQISPHPLPPPWLMMVSRVPSRSHSFLPYVQVYPIKSRRPSV